MARGKASVFQVREIIVKNYIEGKSGREIAKNIGISKSTVNDIIKKYVSTNNFVAGKSKGRPKIISQKDERALSKICKQNRRSTVRDITQKWNNAMSKTVSRECCRKWIHKNGFSFYKVP